MSAAPILIVSTVTPRARTTGTVGATDVADVSDVSGAELGAAGAVVAATAAVVAAVADVVAVPEGTGAVVTALWEAVVSAAASCSDTEHPLTPEQTASNSAILA